MKLIGCHDAATGEPGKGWLSWLLTPWAKTQTKTIREQYNSGCRYFDLRIRIEENGWVLCHGPWVSQTTPESVFSFLNGMGDCYVRLTYEGGLVSAETMINYARMVMRLYPRIKVHSVNIKKPVWRHLVDFCEVPTKEGYISFVPENWQIICGTPWMVNLLFTRKHDFNEERFLVVDFL